MGLLLKSLSLVLFFICSVTPLYEDQIGKFDWRQQYIGKVKELSLEKSSATSRRLFLATEPNVVAAVSLRNGDLVWRQVMEEGGRLEGFDHCDSSVFTVSQHTGTILRAWNTALGHLLWEVSIANSSDEPVALLCDGKKHQVFVVVGKLLTALDSSDGTEIWSKELNALSGMGSLRLAFSSQRDLLLIGVKPAISLAHFTVSNQGVQLAFNSLPAPWLDAMNRCVLVGTSGALICLDPKGGLVHSALLGNSAQWKSESVASFGLPTGSTYQLSALTADHMLLRSTEGMSAVLVVSSNSPPKLLYKLSKVSVGCAVRNGDKYYVITGYHMNQPFSNFQVKVFDLSTGIEQTKLSHDFHIPQHHGAPEELHALLIPKKDGSLTYRLLLLTEDSAIHFVQQTGRTQWLREEALASILAAEMVDLPVSENQAKMDEEFGHNQGNVMEMFVKRITTQLSQLQVFLQEQLRRQHWRTHNPASGGEGLGDSSMESANEDTAEGSDTSPEEFDMTRDDFNLNKMVVVATATGKLFGIESLTGRVNWKYLVRDGSPFNRNRVLLFLQRTTAHFPLPPQCVVVMRSKTTGKPLLFAFNPITGVPVEKTPDDVMQLPYDITQATMLSLTNEEDYLRPVLLLDKEAKVHVYPTNYKLQLEAAPVYLYSIDPDKGRLMGYRVGQDALFGSYLAEPVWRLFLGRDGQSIVATSARPLTEHIHSVGRILGDRSVLYKYLNPNLLAVMTEGYEQAAQKNMLTLYVVDVVAGRIVYSTHHKRAGGPVNLVLSENWIVYSYNNQKSHRWEVSVLELYENSSASSSSSFSSLTRANLTPTVLKQAYILGTPISTTAVSLTEKGITAKSLIFALKTGGILEMPKAMLDPRRPMDMTMELQEEGVEPYMPELPLSTQMVLSYNQSVMGVRGIHTAPAGLESTSLVFVYGLDLFFVRVAPSKMYDVLKEDFDYFFIATVTLGMIVASFVTQRLAQRKALFRAWQ